MISKYLQSVRMTPYRARMTPAQLERYNAYMETRVAENLAVALESRAENSVLRGLNQTGYEWIRQFPFEGRIFDFWNEELGCAVEVDGPTHDHKRAYDVARDKENLTNSGIVVKRMDNFDSIALHDIVEEIGELETWAQRRELMGIDLENAARGGESEDYYALWLSSRNIKRSFGENVVDASEGLKGGQHSYFGQLNETGLLVPAGTDDTCFDPSTLWGAVEAFEVKENSRLAWMFEFDIPRVITGELRKLFVVQMLDWLTVKKSRGFAVEWFLYDDGFCALTTMRRFDGDTPVGRQDKDFEYFVDAKAGIRFRTFMAARMTNFMKTHGIVGQVKIDRDTGKIMYSSEPVVEASKPKPVVRYNPKLSQPATAIKDTVEIPKEPVSVQPKLITLTMQIDQIGDRVYRKIDVANVNIKPTPKPMQGYRFRPRIIVKQPMLADTITT